MSHEITTTHTLTDQQIIDFVITSVEHMGHGCLAYHLSDAQRDAYPGPAFSEKVAQALLDGGTVEVTDRWDYDERGTLTLTRLLDGISKRSKQRGMDPEELMSFVRSDVIDADCAVQYAIWGRIVLG